MSPYDDLVILASSTKRDWLALAFLSPVNRFENAKDMWGWDNFVKPLLTVAELFEASKMLVLSSKELLQGLLMESNYEVLGLIRNVYMSA